MTTAQTERHGENSDVYERFLFFMSPLVFVPLSAGLLACVLALGPDLTSIRLSIEVLLCLIVGKAGFAKLGWMCS